MLTDTDITTLILEVQRLSDTVELLQQQMKNLQTTNKNLTTRLNRVDKQQRDSFQSMY